MSPPFINLAQAMDIHVYMFGCVCVWGGACVCGCAKVCVSVRIAILGAKTDTNPHPISRCSGKPRQVPVHCRKSPLPTPGCAVLLSAAPLVLLRSVRLPVCMHCGIVSGQCLRIVGQRAPSRAEMNRLTCEHTPTNLRTCISTHPCADVHVLLCIQAAEEQLRAEAEEAAAIAAQKQLEEVSARLQKSCWRRTGGVVPPVMEQYQ